VKPFLAALLYVVIAIVLFAGFMGLGSFVVANGEPANLWAWQQSLVNHSTLIAWWITWSCFPYVLLPIAIVLLILAWRLPAWRSRMLLSVVLLVACWRGADFFQHFFQRARPADWVVKHETSFSYPSSHAAIATGFYAAWAVMLYASQLPKSLRVPLAALLLLLAIAICWSRLALGAHYVTDVLGGIVLGGAFAAVVQPLAIFGFFGPPPAGRIPAAEE
jgi:undecaprenyl-diphosphatase